MIQKEQRAGSKKLREKAARLCIELRTEPTDSTRKVLSEWLLLSPDHVQAYLEVAPASGLLQESARRLDDSVAALVAAASAAPEDANVVPLEWAAADRSMSGPRAGKKPRATRWLSVAAAIGIAVLGGILFRGDIGIDGVETYTTGIGEQRSFTLEDGSTVHLNTKSELHVHFDDTVRRIDLVRGEGLFAVTKDPGRPFQVHGGDTIFSALGTRFNVRLWEDRALVIVLEGRVRVFTDQQQAATDSVELAKVTVDAERIELGAGEQASVTDETIRKVAVANSAKVTAWTSRRLIFDSEPLSHVIEEFNRYNRVPVRVVDPGLVALEISGTFDVTDVESLLESLKAIRRVEVLEDGSGTRLIRPQS